MFIKETIIFSVMATNKQMLNITEKNMFLLHNLNYLKQNGNSDRVSVLTASGRVTLVVA